MPVDPHFSLIPYDGNASFKRVRIRHNHLIQSILARIRSLDYVVHAWPAAARRKTSPAARRAA